MEKRMGDINNSTNDNESMNLNDMNEVIDSTDSFDSSNMKEEDLNTAPNDSNLSADENSDSNNTYVNTDADSYMNPIDNSQTETTTNYIDIPRKKVSGKFIALLVALAVVLVGTITAFTNRNVLANTIARMTKSPAEYYAYVEQKGLNTGIDKLTASYDKALATYDEQLTKGVGQDLSLKFTLNPEFTSMLGIGNVEAIEAFITSFGKEGNSKSNVGLSYNGTSLISADFYMNADTSDMFLTIPELSSAYLLFSFDEIMEASGSYPDGFSYSEYMEDFQKLLKDDSLSPETLNKLLKKYSSLIVNNIKNVTVEKGSTFTASDISSKFTTIKAEISDEDAYNIGMAILNEAKNDQVIKDLCKTLDICTEEEYNKAIEDSINELSANKEYYTSESPIVMNVYVDKNGKVKGREFKAIDETQNDSFGYYTTNKGKDIGFTLWFTENDTKLLDVSGKATSKDGAYNGICTVSIEDDTTTSFDIEFENAGMVGDKGYIQGIYTISSNALAGMKVVLDCTADQKQQQVLLKLMYAGVEAATFDIKGKEVDYKDFSFPADSEQIFDGTTDMNSYLATVDYEGFIAKLESALGVEDLESYLQYLIPGYGY